MLFNSLDFLIFFPTITLLYFVLPHKTRWFLLLVGSCIFYMAFIPQYVLILAFTITIDYFVGILLESIKKQQHKKLFLIISIISNIGILFFFKYFNFFNINFQRLAVFLHWNYPIEGLKIILPIGLSFHTFQSLSYIIEVYQGNQKAEKNFGIFALYVMFYPQLVAGPIERPQNLLHQFHEKHYFDFARVSDGLKMMLWGMFKKVVIADRLALFVNEVYGKAENYSSIQLIVATVFFGFQIYCDFSGYSDIAIGAAKVMGFDLMKNFNRPYFSKSISEFWSRWHISLSTWFRDYVYISMGGNRVEKHRWYLNLFVTFLLSGFWHGANWTFIIWGALNGLYLIMSNVTRALREKIVSSIRLNKLKSLHTGIQILITFCLTMFAWIFFRAESLGQATKIIFTIIKGSINGFKFNMLIETANKIEGYGNDGLYLSIFLIIFLIIIEFVQSKIVIREAIDRRLSYFGLLVYLVGIFSIILLGQFSKTQFIYFQF